MSPLAHPRRGRRFVSATPMPETVGDLRGFLAFQGFLITQWDLRRLAGGLGRGDVAPPPSVVRAVMGRVLFEPALVQLSVGTR